MPNSILEQAHADLYEWCRRQDFSGYDPFDALNSRLFQLTPLKHSRAARLGYTQLFKRFPVNLRPLALLPPERNAKGIALFALAALANYRRLRTDEAEHEARALLADLLSLRLEGWSGSAWGYNFDWQSSVFFAPRGTPTIVPTAFAARALLEAAHAFNDEGYLKAARSTCDFILQDLERTDETEEGVCFSYSPNIQTRVYNASLLAGETLASVGALTGEKILCQWAVRAGRYVARQQREDGSWQYGAEANQSWVDNFHTAFLLSSLARINQYCEVAPEWEFSETLRRGYEFWCARFFLADGWPKYYDDKLYPVDTHAAATAIVTLSDLRDLDPDALSLAEKIAHWSIRNLRDRRGFFYYQRRRFYTVRTPYMRWAQAWMLYALARLLEEREELRVVRGFANADRL
jgi:hypothetical protein